jgi:Glycosyl hydrolase family 26
LAHPRASAARRLSSLFFVASLISLVSALVVHTDGAFGSTSPKLASTAAPSTPVAVPASGKAYLGAWVNPASAKGQTVPELAQIGAFNQTIGRSLGIYQYYTNFVNPPTAQVLASISSYGAIPLISWHCTDLQSIISGREDAEILNYASALKAFGKPVLLRFDWEMNHKATFNADCGGYDHPLKFIAAWKHIWYAFKAAGVKNVAFVWNPSLAESASYYPGDKFVDWIGVDGYDRTNAGTGTFPSEFGAFYSEWAPHDKPMLVGETGALTTDQTGYLQGIGSALPTQFPQIKALLYWDSVGQSGNWVLQGDGLKAFASMASQPYFRG